ncbi:MAG: hypothetical protein SFZ24_06950 [Planctomycetota bacterium]|nr:hypothetical protein [Planctomycetota bacterium]
MRATLSASPRFLLHRARFAAALAVASLPLACGPHTIKGRVIEGDVSAVMVVDKNDHRLQTPGVPGASLKLIKDPARLEPKIIAEHVSGTDGEFELPVDEFGAGVIEMDVGLLVRHRGHRSAESAFKVPGGGKRVLVMLERGRDDPSMSDDRVTPQELLDRYR